MAGYILASWITAFLVLPSLSYKLAEGPINITNANETAAKAIRDLMGKNLLHDADEVNAMKGSKNRTNATGGLGGLAQNLEFLMLKVAQLETLVELQQAELTAQQGELESVKKHVGLTASVSMAQRSELKVQDAHDVLKRVLLKHHRQRETREYHEADNAAKAQKALLQRQNSQSEQQSLDSSVSSKSIPFYDEVADAATAAYDKAVETADGTGLTGDALKDAFNQVKDQGKAVEFIQNTVIDTVEKATTILLNFKGFEFSDDCHVFKPDVRLSGQHLHIFFGGQSCSVTLVGKKVELFNWYVGASSEIVQHLLGMSHGLLSTPHCNRADAFHCMAKRVASSVMQFEPPLNWLPQQVKSIASTPMNAVTTWLTLGNDLMDCANFQSSVELTKCLGMKIILAVPPLNFLSRMKEVLTETIMTFARVATQVVKKALHGSASLLQKASTSKFPAVGERIVHHKDKNLLIESHSQHLDASLLQRKPSGAVGYKFNAGQDVHASPLVTQFDGREVDTGSCLAFAPRGKNGAHVANHQEATKTDWTAPSKENFIQLEPWAVPCDNAWMKENWNKWQGYSFYTASLPIEKCLTITFQMGMQPVVAFVGGLEFELLPKPLFALATTVCWPNKMPGGLDLSILRSEIKSGGNLVFSRTLRLAKRFGKGTDFVKANVESSYQTLKHVVGLPTWIRRSEQKRVR
ncbi:unnamed protein product [Effrenium voratum]|nr:unnamed protein product [Effrenium voratum]